MGILDFLNKTNKKTEEPSSPLLPEQVYQAAEMELKDIIAPSALGIQPKSLNLSSIK